MARRYRLSGGFGDAPLTGSSDRGSPGEGAGNSPSKEIYCRMEVTSSLDLADLRERFGF